MSSRIRRRIPQSTQAALTIISLLAIACNDSVPTAPSLPPQSVPPRAVEIRLFVDRLALLAGDTITLTAATYDAAERRIHVPLEWTSADPGVATVGNNGLLTALVDGRTTVTVSAGQLSATASVSVHDVAGTISFTRMTQSGSDFVFYASFDVLSYANRTVTSVPRASQFTSIAAPAWSPDGSLLAVEFVKKAVDDGVNHIQHYESDIYVLSADAEPNGRALTSDSRSRWPSWSADGRRIAYVSGTNALVSGANDDPNHIYIIDATGGTPTRLTQTAGYYSYPRWSPDGTRLAFAESGDVFIVNADGSGLTKLTHSPLSGTQPSWSPDGKRLAFVGAAGALYVIDADGSNFRSLGTTGSGPVWSPDGRYLAFSRSDRLRAAHMGTAIFIMKLDELVPFQLTQPPFGAIDLTPVWKR